MEFFRGTKPSPPRDADLKPDELRAQISVLVKEDFTLVLDHAYYAHF
ncbi:hypothetical protein [Streptomyces ambofaciens]